MAIKMTEQEIISDLTDMYGVNVTSADIRAYCAMKDISYPTVTRRLDNYKTGHGKWNLEVTAKAVEAIENSYNAPAVLPPEEKNLIPEKNSGFVSFGCFTDVKKIIASELFYPVFITGLSGNGKTMCVEQACATLKRELIRFNVTVETDSDDLIGGFRLQDGNTVWHNGPVVEAMERGAILLLDECDLASNKIMVLQSVLEGKPLFLKKIGKVVYPKPGFNIIATANTKGKGSDDGRFIGTNVLNEAFLERFSVTFEQNYPPASIETKILEKLAKSINLIEEQDFIKKLVSWADTIRKTFNDGGIDEVISTRRLVHLLKAYAIFKNKTKAIKLSIARFDDDTKSSFIELYDKIDEEFDKEGDEVEEQQELDESVEA
jgi:MoxR-like ATPase